MTLAAHSTVLVTAFRNALPVACLLLCPAWRRMAVIRRRLCCLQAAAGVPLGSNRSCIWMMLNNISIAEAGKLQCHWPGAAITGPTELHGEMAGPSGSTHIHAHELSEQQLEALEQMAAATAAKGPAAASVQFPGPGLAAAGEPGQRVQRQRTAEFGGGEAPGQRGRANDTAAAATEALLLCLTACVG